jgi:hypothetical protein
MIARYGRAIIAMVVAVWISTAAAAPAIASPAETNAVPAPPMGWNSWNSGIPLNESTIRETADAMVASGMRDAGYRYVNLDAGWAATQRDSRGNLQADPVKFPHGIATLADYLHKHGARLPIKSSVAERPSADDHRRAISKGAILIEGRSTESVCCPVAKTKLLSTSARIAKARARIRSACRGRRPARVP